MTQHAIIIAPAFGVPMPPVKPTLRQLADRLIAAGDTLRTCNDADWNRANDEQADAQVAFRAAVEAATGMPLADLERAMGEA